MGPKKQEKKAGTEEVEGEDPMVVSSNYQKFCKVINLPVNLCVTKLLADDEKYPLEQILIDDEYGQLGPGGTRALMTSIMGTGPNMKGGPYKLLKSIRIWRSNVGDEGAASIAEILRLGGREVQISYLELFENNIGSKGAMALGSSLSKGHNLSLLTLKLDYNMSIGTHGCAELCRGLRTNSTLKQLHISFCGITEGGGDSLSDLLAHTKTNIEILNLAGNKLGGLGLSKLCTGLKENKVLHTLNIADIMIDQGEVDLMGLSDFRDCLLNPQSGLTSVDLLCNRMGERGATILIPALTEENKRITTFLVDLTLPLPIFQQIFRRSAGGKKKKGGKKGGKKK
jgi:hypothetical protein